MDQDKIISKLEKNFDYYRIINTNNTTKLVSAKNKEIKEIKNDSVSGLSIFGVKKNKSAFVSTNELSDKNINKLIDKLKKLAIIGEKIDYLDLINTKKITKELFVGDKSKYDFEEIVKIVEKNSGNENCSVNELAFKETILEKNIITNYLNVKTNSVYSILFNAIVTQENGKMANVRRRLGEQNNLDKNIEDVKNLVSETKKEAKERLNYKSSLKGIYDVIIDPELSHLLAHEAIGHACEADLIYNKESNLKLGQKLSDYNLNVIDDPTTKNSFGYYEFDDEGIKSTKRNLIKNGIVNEFITDIKHAKKLNIPLNGASRSESYSKMPIPRMSDTGIGKGDIPLEELKASLKTGLILMGGKGGQVDTTAGTFQFGVEKAVLIKNGKEENYSNLSFSGNITKDLFKIEGISKEFEYNNNFIGFCGKGGQSVPVSGFGPYMKIKKIRF